MALNLTPLRRLAKRLHPHLRGHLAEKGAWLFYTCHGWRPLRGLPRALAKTDLTLVRGTTLILVEVKYRTSRSRGHVALSPGQHGRLHHQMQALSGRYPAYTLRLEVFLVFPHWPFYQRISQPYVS